MHDLDAFIEARLDKLIRQRLHDHVGDSLTRSLMDRIEQEVYTKCGWAVPITISNCDDDGYLTWETPTGHRNHIYFQDL